MGQFSVTIYGATGSVLNDIQQSWATIVVENDVDAVTFTTPDVAVADPKMYTSKAASASLIPAQVETSIDATPLSSTIVKLFIPFLCSSLPRCLFVFL